MSTKIETDIDGIINELNLSEDDVLFPIFEGVVNSIQAINERGNNDGKIEICIHRDRTKTELFEEFENFPITQISIRDNGIGFDSDNLKSFKKAHSTKKYKIGGKGVGRFAMLAVFDSIAIDTIFEKDKDNHLLFTLTRDGLTEPQCETSKNSPVTKVTLEGVNPKYSKVVARYSDDEIIENIISHCLLYYINGQAPQILYTDNENITRDLNKVFDPNYFIQYSDDGTICEKTFHVSIVKSKNTTCHEICLCGNNRKVKTKRLDSVLPVFSTPLIDDEGSEYYLMIYVVSDYLDSIVKTGRNEFAFPTIKKVDNDDEEDTLEIDFEEDIEVLSENSIYALVVSIVKKFYKDELDIREKEVRSLVNAFVETDAGVEYRHIRYDEGFYSSIKNGATDKQILKALQKYQYKQSLIIRKKEERLLKREYSNKEDYQNLLSEYIQLTSTETNGVLAKYVVHRKVIIKLMEKYLKWCDDNQNYEEEQTLHNLIFTMGENNTTKAYDEHNLWLLDDRLAFYKYIYSDKQIRLHQPNKGKTECAKETDIAVYDVPFGYDDESEDGQVNSIVVFELKRPDRDVSVEEYQKQMMDQVRGLREGRRKTYDGANIDVEDNTPIYFYYVVDDKAYKKLKKDLKQYYRFEETPYHTLLCVQSNLHQEIITYNGLLISARRRNKIFFDKLDLKQ